MKASSILFSRLFLVVTLMLQASLPAFAAGERSCKTSLHGWTYVPESERGSLWGTYICQGPGCGIETSSMPDADGVTRCEGCGKPHSGEDFKPPQTEYRGSQLYILAPGRFGAKKLAESGLKWQCPECEATNFRVVKVCQNCNAPQPHNVEQFLVNDQGDRIHPQGTIVDESPLQRAEQITPNSNPVDSSETMDLSPLQSNLSQTSEHENQESPLSQGHQSVSSEPKATTLTPTESWRTRASDQLDSAVEQALGVIRSKNEEPEKPWKAWFKKGSAVLVAVTASAIIWGVQTFSEPGYVASVDGYEISVNYEHNQKSYSMKLDPEILHSGVRWHVGEPVTLHFTNYKWFRTSQPNAAERSNAEVYQPILLERGGNKSDEGWK